jgi:phage host-nuclease inhibitor protein Gam
MATFSLCTTKINRINAGIELQIHKIREKSKEELAELNNELNNAFETLQAYALQNPSLFTKKKNVVLLHGVIGFRTSTPKLKTLKGFTWASVINLVKEFLPDYIRTSEEVAKDRLLADRAFASDHYAQVGIYVDQDETFYADIKSEE